MRYAYSDDPDDFQDDEDQPECFLCGEPGCPGYCNVEDYNMPHRWEEG
jgi:hypothetical protein